MNKVNNILHDKTVFVIFSSSSHGDGVSVHLLSTNTEFYFLFPAAVFQCDDVNSAATHDFSLSVFTFLVSVFSNVCVAALFLNRSSITFSLRSCNVVFQSEDVG